MKTRERVLPQKTFLIQIDTFVVFGDIVSVGQWCSTNTYLLLMVETTSVQYPESFFMRIALFREKSVYLKVFGP